MHCLFRIHALLSPAMTHSTSKILLPSNIKILHAAMPPTTKKQIHEGPMQEPISMAFHLGGREKSKKNKENKLTQALASAERLWASLAPAAGPAAQHLCHAVSHSRSERSVAAPSCQFSLRPGQASWRTRLPKTSQANFG